MKTIAAICMMLLIPLAACTVPEDIPDPVTTSERSPITLAVAELRISSDAAEPAGGTFKDRRYSARLADKTEEFLQYRIRSGGGEGWANVVIQEALIVEQPLATKGGLEGLLTEEADAQFSADLSVKLMIMDAAGLEQVHVEAKVGRTRPLSENLDVLGRHAEAEILIGDLLRQLDDQLTKAAESELADFRAF